MRLRGNDRGCTGSSLKIRSRSEVIRDNTVIKRMTFTAETSVEELLVTLPAAAGVFEILGIDYCCRQERSLQKACAASGLDSNEVIDILRGEPVVTEPVRLRLAADSPLSELAGEIVRHHHRHARKRLVALIQTVRTLCSAHAGRFPEIWKIRDQIEKLARDLIPHMAREERYLFPYIASLEHGVPDTEIVVPLFGTIEFPLQSVRHDHADDLTTINVLRETTRNFAPPEEACSRFRAFYADLSDFTMELQEHIHVENKVLFPRAVEMEKRAASGPR
jgi:regulator of cell morphogenesis and NO signaling